VLSAFFLEAGFLGVMLFGFTRVGPRLHFAATCMVAVGTLFSAFWIIAVNSWMQTPAGYAINENGQFVAGNWAEIIFNPSFPYRLVHMVLAAYLTTAFAVGAVGAFHLLRDTTSRPARLMFSMAMWMALIVTPVQIFAGDVHGLNTLEYQPRKIAAMEGHWDTQKGAPLILFGIPDENAGKTRYKIEIPHAGALILTHSWNGELKGLKDWPKGERPPMGIVFWSFRIMVGLGFLMLGLGLWSGWRRLRGGLYEDRWLHRASVVMGPSGFVAVLAGWVTTEVGRQPYTVYGLLKTADSVSPLDAPAVAASLVAFAVVYFIVFTAGVFYILRLMNRNPDDGQDIDAMGLTRSSGITPAASVDADRVLPAAW
jgi:cytochrome d ubiquinol oxidase subunit I